MEYNEKHGITPQTVRRAVQESLHTILRGREIASSVINEAGGDFNLTELLRELEEDMQTASANLGRSSTTWPTLIRPAIGPGT